MRRTQSSKLTVNLMSASTVLVGALLFFLPGCAARRSGTISGKGQTELLSKIVYEKNYTPLGTRDIYNIVDFCFTSNEKRSVVYLTNKPNHLYIQNVPGGKLERFPSKRNDFMKLKPVSIAHDQKEDRLYAFDHGVLFELNGKYGVPIKRYRIAANFMALDVCGKRIAGYNNSSLAKPVFKGTLQRNSEEVEELWLDIPLDNPEESVIREGMRSILKRLESGTLIEMVLETIKRTYNLCYISISEDGFLIAKQVSGDIFVLRGNEVKLLCNVSDLCGNQVQVLDLDQVGSSVYLLVQDAADYSTILELNVDGSCVGKYVFGDATHGYPFRFAVLEKGKFLVLVYSPIDDLLGIAAYESSREQKRQSYDISIFLSNRCRHIPRMNKQVLQLSCKFMRIACVLIEGDRVDRLGEVA